MGTALPTSIDADYSDAGSPSRKAHQQHHDAIHGYTNAHDGASDPHVVYLRKADNLLALTDMAAARANLSVQSTAEAAAAYVAKAWRQEKVKTADESVASSIALQNDDHLFFTVGLGETWVWECELMVNGVTAADIAVAFTTPTGTLNWNAHGLDDAAAGSIASLKSDGSGTSGGAVTFGVNNTRQSLISIRGYLAATAAGTVQLQWAQVVADATATQVRIGSHLLARRVA